MPQPTLANVPGILLRTILRLVARIILALAGFLFIGGAVVAYSALLLCTWRSPRPPRVQLFVDFAVAAYALVQDFRTEK